MPSYRGIVLDSIHPNIKAALDVETAGFTKEDPESFNHITTRTPWMRSVPFIRPLDPDNETVPRWQKYVLYSLQGTDLGPGQVPQFGRVGLDSNDTGLYRSDLRNTPIPGITGITVSNKGDLGTIRRATLSLKCYHEKDLEDLEMMYMVPGASVLIEWGWFSNTKTVQPIYLGDLQEKGRLSNIDAIQEELIKKTLDVEDLLQQYSINDPENTTAGLYDGLLGVVTKFNWSNASDGSYDIQIDIISPNSLALAIPTNTYKLGGNIIDLGAKEIGGEQPLIPVNDVELVYYSINSKSTRIRTEQTKDAIKDNLADASVDILSENTDDMTVAQILASPEGLLTLKYSDLAESLGFIEFFVENDKLKAKIVESDPGQTVLQTEQATDSAGNTVGAKGITIVGDDGQQVYTNVARFWNGKSPIAKLQDVVDSAYEQFSSNLEDSADLQEESDITVANSIVFNVNGDNQSAFSWGEVSFPLYDSTNNIPIMTCRPGIGTTVAKEDELSFINSDHNEMGISLYGETYVSWRFIEEYVINELFMPRVGDDKLATKFMSLHPVEKTQEDSDSDEEQPIQYESVKIINNQWLRSLDPTICILPGQELTVSNNGDAEQLPNSSPLNSIKNIFTVGDGYSEGYLRNILVNINVVRDASNNASSVNDFALEILSQVSEACGNPWSFKVITNTALQQVMVIDENYGGDFKGYKTAADQGDNVYKFSGIGLNNICRDVKIQTKLPNEVQALAYYAMSGASSTVASDINMFKLYGTGLEDRLKPVFTSDIKSERDDIELANIWQRYQDLVIRTRFELSTGISGTRGYREAINIAKKFVNLFIHDSSENNPAYSPPIPIDVSLTLNGISGIYMGNAIMLETIDEGGMIPNRYRDIVALQATSVDQSISADGWTTSIGTLMRPVQNLLAPKVIDRPEPEPVPANAITSGLSVDTIEQVKPRIDKFKRLLNVSGVPYVNGAAGKQQTYYGISGNDSDGLFTTEDGGSEVEYFDEKVFTQFIAMCEEAVSAGITLKVNSAWRSYEEQEALYNGYADYVKRGKTPPKFYPADPPGYSSHQDGRSIDFSTQDSSHYKWLVNNAHKFGFRREVKGEKHHWTYSPNQLIYGKVPQNHESWNGEEAIV